MDEENEFRVSPCRDSRCSQREFMFTSDRVIVCILDWNGIEEIRRLSS